MNAEQLVDFLIEDESSATPIGVYANRLALRIFTYPSLCQFMQAIKTNPEEGLVEIVFNRLPQQTYSNLNGLVGTSDKMEIVNFVDGHHARTGVRVWPKLEKSAS